MTSVRYDITFTGRVQGVGFRATTVSIARNFRVTGWVCNESNGSVRCVAEGEQAELDAFVERIKQDMPGYLREAHINTANATDEFDGFTVRY